MQKGSCGKFSAYQNFILAKLKAPAVYLGFSIIWSEPWGKLQSHTPFSFLPYEVWNISVILSLPSFLIRHLNAVAKLLLKILLTISWQCKWTCGNCSQVQGGGIYYLGICSEYNRVHFMPRFQNYKQHHLFSIPISGNSWGWVRRKSSITEALWKQTWDIKVW